MIKIEYPFFPTHFQTSLSRRTKKDKEGKVLNPRIAGTPKYEKINGQYIYNRHYHVIIQGKIIDFIKTFLKQGLSKYDPIYQFPISISLEIHTIKNHGGISIKDEKFKIAKNERWDIGNLGYIWMKCFDDCLTEEGIIPDDSINYVKSTGKVTFIEVDDLEKRKLVFKIETP